jgi:hypothetical protein
MDFDDIKHEHKLVTMFDNTAIDAIKDPEALGVYTYMKMLLDEGITKGMVIFPMIEKQFNMPEKEVFRLVKYLNKLGFMMMSKEEI